jgi:hypothetical protein
MKGRAIRQVRHVGKQGSEAGRQAGQGRLVGQNMPASRAVQRMQAGSLVTAG